MKEPTASLYVQSYDLLLWMVRFVEKLSRPHRQLHGEPLLEAARALVVGLSVALKHPGLRGAQLVEAELALERLRVATRLAGDCGVMTERQRHFLVPQVESLGRMLGGWQKQARAASRFVAQDEPPS